MRSMNLYEEYEECELEREVWTYMRNELVAYT